MTSLEEMLGEKPASAEATPAAQGSPQTGETEKPAPEQGKAVEATPAAATPAETGEKPNGATPAPSATPPEDDRQSRAFQKAAEDERHKRQALEREFEELRRQNAEIQRQLQAQQRPQQQPPEFLDPEGTQFLHSRFNAALQERDAAYNQALLETRVVQSQEIMRGRHADYDEVEAVFAEAMDADPTLVAKMQAHPMPALFAYQEGKRHKVLKEMGTDPESYIASRVEAALAKRQAEQQPAPQATPATPTPPPPPPSLATIPSATSHRAQAWQGPVSLDDLLSQPLRRSR